MIKDKIDAPVDEMGRAISAIKLEDTGVYADFLAQTYYYVSHSTRMLAFAAGLMPNSEENYFRRFVRHIGEESSHEVLAQKDLEDLGFKVTQFFHKPETRALWEPQYYKMLHEDPMSLMGYILALEHFSCVHLPAALERIEKAYGGKAGRFIKLHAEEDPDHVKKAIEFSESLSPERQERVLVNVYQTAKTYTAMVLSSEGMSQAKTESLQFYNSQQNFEAGAQL